MNALKDAIVSRWNNAGLDDSLGDLYYGEDQASPEEQAIPRFQFAMLDDLEEMESRGGTVRVTPLQIETFRNSSDTCADDLKSIQDAFKNSHKAATNPLTVTDGTVNHVKHISQTVFQEDDTTFRGIARFSIKWTEANTVPS